MRYETEERPLKMPWARKLRTGILGVVDGAVYSGTMLLLIWQWRAAADARNAIASAISGDYVDFISTERWIPIVLIWVVTFTLASLVVDYFWQNGNRHILFWVAVGLIAIASWNVFVLFGTWLDKQAGDPIGYSRVTSSSDPLFGPISLGMVVLVNSIYGYIVHSLFRKEQPTDGDGVDLRLS
jgi:hypothetical protein